ncbi:hypothetical protein K502DRAFT_325417 [Neoconidiobolus thromboides FSU 785]|nr:hypothetical protein K502DRAFT_325417 [Neoconidiobolus thromboides FSU 785]
MSSPSSSLGSLPKELNPIVNEAIRPKTFWDSINPLNALEKLNAFKSNLNLPNPGVYEELHREVKNVLPSNFLIEGGSFEFIKAFSNHLQVNNSFTLGSSQMPSSYNFIGVYSDENVFAQTSVDNEYNFSGRLHYILGNGLKAKAFLQTGLNVQQSMLQLESDYAGPDNALNIKAINPSVSDSTGIFLVSYLQSITKNLALGSEALFQRTSKEMEDSSLSFTAKYATPESILTAQVMDQGMLQASYFHKVSEMAETGVDLQIIAAQGKRDAICTLGTKFEFSAATMRTSIDTTGKVSTVLEEHIVPPLSLTLSAELDHLKGASKFGFGVRFQI